MMKKKIKKLVFNVVQLLFIMAPQPVKMLVAGRGLGKSTILAWVIKEIVETMPRSNNVIVGPTFKSMAENTLPSTLKGLELIGLYRDIHYIIGKEPPKGWPKPYEAPLDWKHYFTFYNGTGFGLISQDKNAGGGRGKNVDSVLADECLLLDKEQLDNDVILTNRGNEDRFGDSRWHHSVTLVSTHARTQEGGWIYEIEKLAKKHPEKYFYLEGSSFHNAANLGKQFFKNAKAILGTEGYNIEVKNIRPKRVENGFYPSLEKKHYYTNYNTEYYSGIDINNIGKITCEGDADLSPSDELIVSIDWGVFNSMCVMQQKGKTIYVIKEFYVLHPQILDDLIDDFIGYYEPHQEKHIEFYYDRNGNNRRPDSKKTFAEETQQRFENAGWTVSKKVKGLDASHNDKYEVLGKVLREDDNRLYRVRINKHNCPNLVIALENAKAKQTDAGVGKDKTSERRKSIPPQHATHLTDAFDIPIYKMNKPLLGRASTHVPVATA